MVKIKNTHTETELDISGPLPEYPRVAGALFPRGSFRLLREDNQTKMVSVLTFESMEAFDSKAVVIFDHLKRRYQLLELVGTAVKNSRKETEKALERINRDISGTSGKG